jgi:hypothetical protein
MISNWRKKTFFSHAKFFLIVKKNVKKTDFFPHLKKKLQSRNFFSTLRKKMHRFVLFVCSLLFVCARGNFPEQTELWFDAQKLDHFDVTERRVFKQRYFEINEFWNKPYGPVLLYVNEKVCENFHLLNLSF